MTHLEETVQKSVIFLERLQREVEQLRRKYQELHTYSWDYNYKQYHARMKPFVQNPMKPIKMELEDTIQDLKCALNDPLRNQDLTNTASSVKNGTS